MFLYIFSGIFILLSIFGICIMIRSIVDLCVLSYEKRKAKRDELERLRKENLALKKEKGDY